MSTWRSCFVVIAVLLLSVTAYSQHANKMQRKNYDWCTLNWSANYGNEYDEYFNKMIITTDNCILGLGDAELLIADSLPLIQVPWLAKTSFNGTLLWERIYEPDSMQGYSSGLIETPDGGFLISVTRNYNYLPDTTFLYKTDSLGEIQWQRKYSYLLEILFPINGGYLLAGNTAEDYFLHDSVDIAMVIIDSVGNVLHESRFGTDVHDSFTSCKYTPDGGFIVAGNYEEWTGVNYFICKVDQLSNILWFHDFGGDEFDVLTSMIVNDDGSILLAGMSDSNDTLINNYGYSDYWLVKTDSTGLIRWQRNYGGTGSDMYPIMIASPNGYLIAGVTESTDYDVTFNHGLHDGWLMEIDTAGNLLWEKTFGGSDQDALYGIKPLDSLNYALFGYSMSPDGDLPGNFGEIDGWLLSVRHDFNIRAKNYPVTQLTPLIIFPNPANESINLMNATHGSSYTIYDIRGIVKLKGIFNGEINIQTLAPGVYNLHIENQVSKFAVIK